LSSTLPFTYTVKKEKEVNTNMAIDAEIEDKQVQFKSQKFSVINDIADSCILS